MRSSIPPAAARAKRLDGRCRSIACAWLLPISQPPIRDAWLRTDRGRIVAFGHSRPGDFTAADEIDLGDVAVLPGLVNAHTHLELSWMRGRIPETDDFGEWIRTVIELKNRRGRPWRRRSHRRSTKPIREASCDSAPHWSVTSRIRSPRLER